MVGSDSFCIRKTAKTNCTQNCRTKRNWTGPESELRPDRYNRSLDAEIQRRHCKENYTIRCTSHFSSRRFFSRSRHGSYGRTSPTSSAFRPEESSTASSTGPESGTIPTGKATRSSPPCPSSRPPCQRASTASRRPTRCQPAARSRRHRQSTSIHRPKRPMQLSTPSRCCAVAPAAGSQTHSVGRRPRRQRSRAVGPCQCPFPPVVDA